MQRNSRNRQQKVPRQPRSVIERVQRQGGGNPIVRDIGQCLQQTTLNGTTGNYVAQLSPSSLSTRTGQFAENYNLYRFKSFALELMPTAGPATAAAIVINAIDSVSTTVFSPSSTMQLPYAVLQNSSLTVPQRLELLPKDLRGKSAATWYKTVAAGSVDVWDDIHLTLVVSGDPATAVVMRFYWELEFTDAAPAQLVPKPLKDVSYVPPIPNNCPDQRPKTKLFK